MTKKQQHTDLITKQITKLDLAEFDLEAWKSGALYILKMIFGADDPKLTEIDNLKIDYSSWALRDSSASYKPIETAKKKGREIMEIALDELQLLDATSELTTREKLLIKFLDDKQQEQYRTGSAEEKKKVLQSLKKDQLIELLISPGS